MWKKLLKNILIGFIIGSNLGFGFKAVTGNLNTVNSMSTTVPKSTQNSVSSKMTYGRFLEYLEMDWVKQVDLYDNGRNAIIKASSPELGNRPQTIRVEIPVGASQLISKLKECNVDFDAHPTETSTISAIIATNLIIPLIFIVSLAYFLQNSDDLLDNEGQSSMNFGQQTNTNNYEKRPDPAVRFENIAGIDEAKAEIEEVVSFLKEPDKYTIVGAKIPKGILLVGPPGTGKTLLAKAIANEADVRFFSAAASEFVEMYVGVGASRVRELFEKASDKSPSIVFIDEIDAIGRERGNGVGNGNDEREQTLNQLLTEMDGFGTNTNVIVIAATNRADVLDKALMRAGRFDRQIFVDLPDVRERKAIFKVHLRPLKKATNLDVEFLSKQTPGFSGADIANVCNEAALIAARKNKKSVSKQDFLDAVDRIVGGLEKKNKIITPDEKKAVAYHEAGHATVSWMLEHAAPLVKVTIVPRGQSLGAAWYLPEERLIVRPEQMLDEMCAALGGRAAEKVIFNNISTGALSDLEKVTKQARAMVTVYGLNDKVGNLTYYDSSNGNEYGFTKPYSEKTAETIDKEISSIIEKQYQRAIKLLEDNKSKLIELAEVLLDKEVIFKDNLEKIFGSRPFDKEVINS